MDETTYGPAEVCRATGVARPVLHSWIARNYLPLPPGPGMGRERAFTFLNALHVAVVGQLVRLGVAVGMAGHAVRLIDLSKLEPPRGRRFALVIAPGRPATAAEAPKAGPAGLVAFKSYRDIEAFLPRLAPDSPLAVIVVDVTALAERTAAALASAQAQAAA